jgi:hypothetical protein
VVKEQDEHHAMRDPQASSRWVWSTISNRMVTPLALPALTEPASPFGTWVSSPLSTFSTLFGLRSDANVVWLLRLS